MVLRNRQTEGNFFEKFVWQAQPIHFVIYSPYTLLFIDSLQKIVFPHTLSEKIATLLEIFSGQDTKNNDWIRVSFF